jgi:hypothetical protein
MELSKVPGPFRLPETANDQLLPPFRLVVQLSDALQCGTTMRVFSWGKLRGRIGQRWVEYRHDSLCKVC